MNRIIRSLIIALVAINCCLAAVMAADIFKTFKGGITFWHRSVPEDPILTEAAHIYFCQAPDLGCYNDILPADGSTWVFPRENGTAILGLIEAYFTAGSVTEANELLSISVQQAAIYLYFRQEADGAWCKEYNEVLGSRPNPNKSPSETGSVLLALCRIHEAGLEGEAPGSQSYYQVAKRGAQFIFDCIDKKPGGAGIGLAGAGKEYGYTGNDDHVSGFGTYRWSDWCWISDNCYAYQALKCMNKWATEQADNYRVAGDTVSEAAELVFADSCTIKANGILTGINSYMHQPSPCPVWYRVVGVDGLPVTNGDSTLVDSLCYYPVKMNVCAGTPEVAQWMTDNLQKNVGGLSQGMGAYKWGDAEPVPGKRAARSDRLSPGFSMEAWIALNNISSYAARDSQDRAKMWWEAQEGTDGSGQLWDYHDPFDWEDNTKGGFVDWYDPDGDDQGFLPDGSQKFIDTSAYAIMVYTGGYSYDLAAQWARPMIVHHPTGAIASDTVFVTSGTITTTTDSKDKSDASSSMLALAAPASPAASTYLTKYRLDGLKQVNMYYYADGEAAISTATVRIAGRPATYNFSFAVPVKLEQHKYLYYCIEVIDSRGFHTFWPSSNRKQFYRVDVRSFVERPIGANGGTVELVSGGSEGNTSVEIPAGVFSSNVTIKIDELPTTSNDIQAGGSLTGNSKPLAVYEFTITPPRTEVFNQPVTMRLHYNLASLGQANEDSLRVFWWDGIEWRLVGGEVDKVKHLVSTKVKHFSKYAIFPTKGLSDDDYRPKERIITPASGDGYYDFAQFGGIDNIDVINIYNVNGRRIRQLHDVLIWDGKNDSGSIVESGIYIYQIKLKQSGKIVSGTIAIAK